MGVWVAGIDVVKNYELSKAILGQKYKAGATWVRKTADGRIEVDSSSPVFQSWIEKAVKNSKRRKSERAAKKEKNESEYGSKPIKSGFDKSQLEDIDITKLAEQSQRAELQKPIIDNTLQHYKIEKAKTALELESGNIVEWQLCEFLFLGYLERANQEFLMFPKKLEPSFEHLIQDCVIRSPIFLEIENDVLRKKIYELLSKLDVKKLSRELVRMNIREIEEIIRKVKRDQAEDVQNYRQNRGL